MNAAEETAQVTLAASASDEWLEFAAQVSFGERGARYRRLHLHDQVARLFNPVFLSARLSGRLCGIYALDRRCLQLQNVALPGVYRALFAVDELHRQRGVGRALAQAAMSWIDAQAAGTPWFSYGCIDSTNQASLAVLHAQGGQVLGQLNSQLVYRQWPVCSPRLMRYPDHIAAGNLAIDDSDAVDVTPCSLAQFGFHDRCGPRILARAAISAVAMTGGSTLAALATRLLIRPWPAVRKRFDPEAIAYLRLSHLQIRAGCDDDLPEFLAALLAQFNLHYALIVIRADSNLYRRVSASGILSAGIGPRFLPAPRLLYIVGRWHPLAAPDATGIDLADLRYDLVPVDL